MYKIITFMWRLSIWSHLYSHYHQRFSSFKPFSFSDHLCHLILNFCHRGVKYVRKRAITYLKWWKVVLLSPQLLVQAPFTHVFTYTNAYCHVQGCFGELYEHSSLLFLVTLSRLCRRTWSDRMVRCVIDFHLESAACCFPWPTTILS